MAASHGSGALVPVPQDTQYAPRELVEAMATRLEEYAANQAALVGRIEAAIAAQAKLTDDRFNASEDKLKEAM